MYANFLVFGLTFILVIKAKLNLPKEVITKRKLQYCDMKVGGGGGWALLELTDALHVYIMTLNFSGRAYYQASVVM